MPRPKKWKEEAIKAAKELGYSKEWIEKLENCETEAAASVVLRLARWDGNPPSETERYADAHKFMHQYGTKLT